MQKIGMDELKDKLRKTFRDEHKIQWSDELLDGILFEAQREYALNSGDLSAEYKVLSGNSPVYELPEDFYQVIRVIGADGKDIPIVSYRKLAEDYGDFRNIKGDKAKYFCFNFDGFGKFRIFPVLPAGIFAGTIIYNCMPEYGTWIGKNGSALEQYALFLMYQFTGKAQAINAYNEFINIINREQRKKLSIGSKNITRTGVFY